MLTAQWAPYTLKFTFEAVTSRERMWNKRTYFVRVADSSRPGAFGVGECALFAGLSADDKPDYEQVLARLCRQPEQWRQCEYPSIRFGFETAFRALEQWGKELPATDWHKGVSGIPINGLVWMGDKELMRRRIAEKLAQGFRVLKLKIGGIDFDAELDLLRSVRHEFAPSDLEIRLDANGSFTPANWLERLDALAKFSIHSLEQPLKPEFGDVFAEGVAKSAIPLALDEQLIGWRTRQEAAELLDRLKPHYIILKPALIGGVEVADNYIAEARQRGIGWWATSALESNVGLFAIADWLAHKPITMPQGLGTGQLYSNNFASPLEMRQASLFFNPNAQWQQNPQLNWQN